MSDIDPAWCLERFLSSCFPGKGKKRSIVPTHTPRRSSSRPDGCCVFWSDSSQTETASLKRFDDRRRIEQRNDLFVQKRGHWDSLLHFHTGTHCRTLEVMQGVLCLAQWHCGSNDCSHLYFRCLRFLKLHQTPKLFNKPEYISLISQFYFRFWSPTTPEGNMWLCCCWRQGFHNKTQFPVFSVFLKKFSAGLMFKPVVPTRWWKAAHLYSRRSPAQVLQRSGCEAGGYSSRPLLHHQDDAPRLRPQLLHQVFQLPAHLDQSQTKTLKMALLNFITSTFVS